MKNKTSKNQPKVSVLMTAYNAEKYLDTAVQSILHQTYSNFEFIVVDDASTDKTPDIISAYAKHDKRIKVVTLRKNVGPAKAGDRGLRLVRGKYLFRMDADDISSANRLACQVSYLEKNPEVVLLGGQCILIDNLGQQIGKKNFPTENKCIRGALFDRNPIQHPACVINLQKIPKKAIFADHDSVLAHDLELIFVASNYGKLANLKDYILSYRHHSDSFSLKNTKKTFWVTLKTRFLAIKKYGYRPSLKSLAITFAQVVIVSLLPEKLIYPLYSFVLGRGISVKIKFDANFILQKAFGLVRA